MHLFFAVIDRHGVVLAMKMWFLAAVQYSMAGGAEECNKCGRNGSMFERREVL
jgi:hypothetical protein